jgi:hypothetical protein
LGVLGTNFALANTADVTARATDAVRIQNTQRDRPVEVKD